MLLKRWHSWLLLLVVLQAVQAAAWNSTALLGLGANNVTSMLCIENFSQQVDKLYENDTHSITTLEKLVRNVFVPCLTAAEASKGLDVRLLSTGIPTENSSFSQKMFKDLATQFNDMTSLPYRIEFNYLGVNAWTQLVDEILMETRRNLSHAAHTGFLYGGIQVPVFAVNGAMADLSDLVVAEGQDLGWLDILPFVRQQMATYGGKLVGIPFDMRVNMIYYRMDILHKLKLPRPETFDDLVELAERVNGTRMGPGGSPMWALCNPYMARQGNCTTAHNYLWDVVAPYIQTQGPTQGMCVDPNDLTILFDSEAGQAALDVIAKLLKYTLPSDDCNGQYSQEYTEGKCIMTFGRVAQFKNNHLGPKTVIRGKSRGYACPGSARVLDRATKKLVPCTNDTCPFAINATLLDGSTALVNQAPFAPAAGYAAAVSSVVPLASRTSTFRFLSYVAQSQELYDSVLDPTSFLGPMRTSHFTLQQWVDRGYDIAAAKQFLEVTMELLGQHPNLALPPNFVEFSTVMATDVRLFFVSLIAGKITPNQMIEGLVSKWSEWFNQLGRDVALQQLRAALNWVPPAPRPIPPEISVQPPSFQNQRNSWKWKSLVISFSIFGAFLLVFATLSLMYWRRRMGMGLFGTVLPPHEGPATTLLVTDIQDSTSLWENLPMDVMDSVLKVHHDCLRSLLPAHRGYESATEGDSFILAFHDSHSALTYAMQVQRVLLEASWPVQLLQHPGCKPVYMRLAERDPLDMKLDHPGHSPTATTVASGAEEDPPIRSFVVNIWDRTVSRPQVDQLDVGHMEFSQQVRQAWNVISPSEAMQDTSAVMAYRGLRVRMGLVSGVNAGERVVNTVDDRRTHYTGASLALAKLVADCGAGGTVTLSASTYKQLPMEKMWKETKLWHAGMHLLDQSLSPIHIYQAVPQELSCRGATIPPVRSLSHLERGAMDAPTGTVAIGFMKVVGLDILKRWNPTVTAEAVSLWQQLVLQQLQAHRGYLVEAKEDLVLAAFGDICDGLLWATNSTAALLHADWSEDLLGHELGEQVSVILEADRPGDWKSTVMMRGLRVKTGMDWGPVLCSIQPMTGKMAYRGRVMNRAARIAAKATPGQVLTSSYTWTASDRTPPLIAVPVGSVKLKGILEEVFLVQVKNAVDPESAVPVVPPVAEAVNIVPQYCPAHLEPTVAPPPQPDTEQTHSDQCVMDARELQEHLQLPLPPINTKSSSPKKGRMHDRDLHTASALCEGWHEPERPTAVC